MPRHVSHVKPCQAMPCHVMSHGSQQQPGLNRIKNRHFIRIAVQYNVHYKNKIAITAAKPVIKEIVVVDVIRNS